MPPPVHGLEIKSVGDSQSATGTNRRIVRIRRRRRRSSRLLERLQLWYLVFEGRMGKVRRRPADFVSLLLSTVRGCLVMRPAYFRRTRRLVIIVGRGAARTATRYARVYVTH